MKSAANIIAAIVVVAVLVAILMPVNTGQPVASRTVRMSNLKQITLANLLYASDANDYLPTDALRTDASDTSMAERCKSALAPYLKNPALWVYRYEQEPIGTSPRIGMDGHVSNFCTVGDFWFDHRVPGSNSMRARVATGRLDKTIPFLRDNIYADPADRKRELHDGADRLLIAYADGHVKAVPQAEFILKAKVL